MQSTHRGRIVGLTSQYCYIVEYTVANLSSKFPTCNCYALYPTPSLRPLVLLPLLLSVFPSTPTAVSVPGTDHAPVSTLALLPPFYFCFYPSITPHWIPVMRVTFPSAYFLQQKMNRKLIIYVPKVDVDMCGALIQNEWSKTWSFQRKTSNHFKENHRSASSLAWWWHFLSLWLLL